MNDDDVSSDAERTRDVAGEDETPAKGPRTGSLADVLGTTQTKRPRQLDALRRVMGWRP